METLMQSLQSAGIECKGLDLLAPTDKGDVLFFSTRGGDEAIRLWKRLHQIISSTGHWPVLLGTPDELDRHRENAAIGGSVRETLTFSDSIDPRKWFDRRDSERLEEFLELNEGEDPNEFLAPVGTWPAQVVPNNQFHTSFAIGSRTPHKSMVMGLVPTTTPWEVPAFLRVGGWNDCPEAAVHCGIHRYWESQFGAVIVAATADVVEMDVSRPPGTREAAMELAKQQYNYCSDIVDQGTETLSLLAASLLNGAAWSFWWD